MTNTGVVRRAVVTPVAFRDPPLLNSFGVHQPWQLRAIIQLETSEGLIGLGETHGDKDHVDELNRVASAFIGLSVFNINGARHRVSSEVKGDYVPLAGEVVAERRQNAIDRAARVFSPFEVAMLDVQGQIAGVPVHALLGGKVRDRVPFSAYLFYKWAGHPGAEPDVWGEALDSAGMVRQARTMIDRYGFKTLKFKGGVLPPDEEIDTVRRLAEAFPDHGLRIDPNAAWTVETSIKVATELDGLLEYLEDPTPGQPGMAAVAKHASMPLATNMCVVSFRDIPEAVRLGSVGVVLADHHYWGGLVASRQLAAHCDTFGWEVSMHSASHLGISFAAMVHLGAAVPQITYDCDTHTPWADQEVVSNPLVISDGAVTVPDTPGLGVQLDPEALAELHAQYLEAGFTQRDDTGYMRQANPDFVVHNAYW